jgi:hypothetical protein
MRGAQPHDVRLAKGTTCDLSCRERFSARFNLGSVWQSDRIDCCAVPFIHPRDESKNESQAIYLMDGSYRFDESAIPLGEGQRPAQLARLRGQLRTFRLPDLTGRRMSVARMVREASEKASPHLARLGPAIRAHLAFLGVSVPEEEPEEPTAEQVLLAALDSLDRQQQDAVARNLSLLWQCFLEEFNGLSGFYQAPATQQAAYLEKLGAAAARMEASRVPEARYHYVSVALMRHYVSSFQARSTEPSAIALSHRVAALIDEGR